ncbi:Fe-S cluster assembly protein SufD [Alphaproteobacteria bacterium]|nr:Fe-S cluster assembly protein SufD [Alphaproteobacteria bacterium]
MLNTKRRKETDHVSSVIPAYQSLYSSKDHSNDPAWLRDVRAAGLAAFTNEGFPSLRNERWKYTNLTPLDTGEFTAVEPANDAFKIGPKSAWAQARMVFVNGVYREDLSDINELKGQVKVVRMHHSLSTMKDDFGLLIDEALPTVGLNSALMQDGYRVVVADKAKIDGVLEVVFANSGHKNAVFPRNSMKLGKDSVLTLVERHIGQGSYFTNSVGEVNVQDGAKLHHYRLQDDDISAISLSHSFVRVGANALYDNFALSTGAKLARNEISCVLEGEGGHLNLLGAYLISDAADGKGQICDTTTFIDHAVANTTSKEVYKGVLDGRGHGVFQGKILVREDAQKIVGNQLSRALMLSDKAEINTKPELEIYADDVICSHGATVGDLDDESLFYLRSRGIPKSKARALLVKSFIGEVLEEIDHEAVREAFTEHASNWLIANAEG